jgi:hypothetical protein
MKKSMISVLTLAVALQGCTPIIKETRYSGGYPGYLLDKRTFFAARSKSLILLRANIILAMAARMGTASIHDGKDADAFADYLAAAGDELNYAAADLYGVDTTLPCTMRSDAVPAPAAFPATPERIDRNDGQPTPIANQAPPPATMTLPLVPNGCSAYYANFESDLPLLEDRIIRLMLAALPAERARAFLKDVGDGNVLAAAWNALRVIYDAAGGLHRATGVYRSGLELVASNSASCENAFNQAHGTVLDAAKCLGIPEDKLFSSANVEAANDPSRRPSPDLTMVKRDAFHAAMLIAETSCARLPINSDGTVSKEVAKRNLLCDRLVFAPQYRPVRLK